MEIINKKERKTGTIMLSAEAIVHLLRKELNLFLEIRGKDYFGLCPFHKEKTPSFTFEPEKKIFKCFGCGFSAGTVFKFWAEYKKTTLPEAKKEISQLGYYVETEGSKEKIEETKEEEILSLVSEIYQHNLFSISSKEIFNYLKKERNLDHSSIINFGLACTVSHKQLANLFSIHGKEVKKDWTKELFSLGLLRVNNNNQVYDFFPSQQLIFPLLDENNKIIAFAGRKIGGWQENKYYYLPNYAGYQKSAFLYNYSKVKQLTKIDYCYLVEGFFDVISLDQAGVKNCLALLGTNVSKEQIELLKKLKKKVILFLDGDVAGKQASIKIIIALLEKNIDCEVINHAYNYDPDELCRFKSEELAEICQKKADPYLFILQHFAESWEIRENPQSISHFIQKIAELFNNFPSRSHRFLIEKINQITNWSEEEIEEIYFAKPSEKTKNEVKIDKTKDLIIDLEKKIAEGEKDLLHYCLKSRHYWLNIQKNDYFFISEENRYLYQYIYNFYTSNFYEKFDSKKMVFFPNNEEAKQDIDSLVNYRIPSLEFPKLLEEIKRQQNIYWQRKNSKVMENN